MARIIGSFGSFSVNDIKKAEEFYSRLEGLTVRKDDSMEFILHLATADGSKAVIYEKPDHEPASFTVLSLIVDNIEQTAAEFKNLGITFEKYDRPGLKTDDKGIMRVENMSSAWFKDPAGNILSIMELSNK